MNLESQVTSLELSKKLKELEIKQESLFYWIYLEDENPYVYFKYDSEFEGYPTINEDICSAFTASELLELLPAIIKREYEYGLTIYKSSYENLYEISYSTAIIDNDHDRNFYLANVNCQSFCNALAKILIHLIENKLVHTENNKPEPYTNEMCSSGMIRDCSL